MDNFQVLQEVKADFEVAFNDLPTARKIDIAEYYSTKPLTALVVIMREAKREAESLFHWADRKGYGLGEIGYNINEHAKSFAEEIPELEKQYKRLLTAYIDALDEAERI